MEIITCPDQVSVIPENERGTRFRAASLLVGCLLVASLLGCAQSPRSDSSEAPQPDPETSRVLHRGRIVYQQHCTKCHDSDGDGRPFMSGSNLRRVAGKISPDSIRQALSQGQGEMPSFAGVLNEQQIHGVIQYLLLDLLDDAK